MPLNIAAIACQGQGQGQVSFQRRFKYFSVVLYHFRSIGFLSNGCSPSKAATKIYSSKFPRRRGQIFFSIQCRIALFFFGYFLSFVITVSSLLHLVRCIAIQYTYGCLHYIYCWIFQRVVFLTLLHAYIFSLHFLQSKRYAQKWHKFIQCFFLIQFVHCLILIPMLM